jgi:S-adenosylmethionine-diacylgycerolhomoserine-N-methlytransferase
MTDTAQSMDKQYRYQRYIYDISRKYYLFGRDKLLKQIQFAPKQTVLEMGCGTGRNLMILQKQQPEIRLFGMDASQAMLNIASKKTTDSIILRQGLAQELDYQQFGLSEPFDHIIFSYVLSMIPEWREAIQQALKNLKPGGYLHIVDFSDQKTMPSAFRYLLRQWLHLFHVHPDSEVPAYLNQLAETNAGTLSLEHLAGRYALRAHFCIV